MTEKNKKAPLLEIQDLRVLFPVHKKWLPAVDGVNLSIRPGEITGVVGESGSGKSVMSQSILRLRDHDTAVKYEGEILFEGENLLKKPLDQMRGIRGERISIIFQDPLNSLSPVHTVGMQLSEILMLHKSMTKQEARERVVQMLEMTGIPNPENCIRKYPYELSGGMQQRVMIAMALACEPKLLIADEPTTALDVTIQAQILQLLKKLAKEEEMSIILITHDLSVVAEVCDRVQVMYCGRFVETASREAFFESPMHPYSKGLLKCIPYIGMSDQELYHIPGNVMHPADDEGGCSFAPRCPDADERCRASVAPMTEAAQGHYVRCFRCGASPMTSTEKEESDVSAGNE